MEARICTLPNCENPIASGEPSWLLVCRSCLGSSEQRTDSFVPDEPRVWAKSEPEVYPKPELVRIVARKPQVPRPATNAASHQPRTHKRFSIVDGKKFCKGCDKWLPADEEHFSVKAGTDGVFVSRCRKCTTAHQLEWQKAKRAKEKAARVQHHTSVKNGKKKCCICENWFPANKKHFYQNPKTGVFASRCRRCMHKDQLKRRHERRESK